MAGGMVCSSSRAFRRDFPPLALSFSVERGTPNSMAKSWNDVPSRPLFSKASCIFSSIGLVFSCWTLTQGMVVAVGDELHYCKNDAVICGVSQLRLIASDFLFYPTTTPGTLPSGPEPVFQYDAYSYRKRGLARVIVRDVANRRNIAAS